MSTARAGGHSARGPQRLVSLPALFVSAFAAGTALVVAGEALSGVPGFAGLGRLGLATCGPVVVMVLYFALARRIVLRRGGNTIEQVADSLYFLGFLFTLVALLSALVTLVEIDTAGIVSRFGLALVTTLAGLLAKVTLTQFTIGLEQRREHAEASLSRAITDFERALDAGTGQLDRHLSGVEARIQFGVEELLTHTTRVSQTQLTTLNDVAEALLGEMADAVRSVGTEAAAGRDELEGLARSADTRSKTLLDRSEAHLAGFVTRAESHAQALTAALGTALASVGDVTEGQRAHGRLLDEAHVRLSAHAANDGALTTLVERTGTMCTRVAEAADGLEARSERESSALQAQCDVLSGAAERLITELAELRAQQHAIDGRRRESEREAAERAAELVIHHPMTAPDGVGVPDIGALQDDAGAAANDQRPPVEPPPVADSPAVRIAGRGFFSRTGSGRGQ